MSPMLEFPGQAPTDPAYERFRDDLKKVAKDPDRTARWRWHARDGKWYAYAEGDWVLEDVGLADTSPQMAMQSAFGFPKPSWSVNELFLPDLFRRLQGAYAEAETKYPGAVWSPWGGGDWRNAFKRSGPIPVPPKPDDPPPLNPECERRIKDVQTYHRRGFITYDQQQVLIADIVAECT